MRRQVGAGAQPVAAQDRGGHARRRGLAVGAHHVDRRDSAPAASRATVMQPAHPVQAEAHAEQLEAEEVALGVGEARHSCSSSRRRRSSFSRSACDELLGRLGHEALVGELALGARDLAAQALALGGALARLLGGVDERARADLGHAAGERHGGGRLAVAARGPAAPSAPPARRRRRGRRRRAGSTWPGLTPASSRQERSAVTAAMTAPTRASASGSRRRVVGPAGAAGRRAGRRRPGSV